MDYTTTRLQPTRSYPTYQFYAVSDAKTLPVKDVFHICILETLRWLRSRLRGFESMPPEIQLPEPEDYQMLEPEMLRSFSFSSGIMVDVVYAEKHGSWSFRISEADMGANQGSERERPPVIGRTFQTDIAFKIHGDSVEVGVRTLCSDLYDCKMPCEVFRPTVVKALTRRNDLGLQRDGFRIDGRPFVLDSKAAVERFAVLFADEAFDLPIVIIAQSGFEETAPVQTELPSPGNMLSISKGFGRSDITKDFHLDLSKANLKTKAPSFTEKPEKSEKPVQKPALAMPQKQKPRRLDDFPYETLSTALLGFAVTAYASERCIPLLKNKCGIQLNPGDLAVFSRGKEMERHPWRAWSKDTAAFSREFRDAMRQSPKRSDYQFGHVDFLSKARLQELRDRRHETGDLTEKCMIYRQEKEELKRQVQELSQQNADLRLNGEQLRLTQKKLLTAQDALDAAEAQIRALQAIQAEREESYRRAGELVAFYREKADIAAEFPTSRDKICDWAESRFADNLVITADARSALRKYDTAFDLAVLCDGLLYLSAYARYRRSELSRETLGLFAERYTWEVQGCGKEALKMRREDYTITYDGKPCLLDQHIKYGVSTQALVRVYFHWEESLGKLIIGYMPGHLATVKKGT